LIILIILSEEMKSTRPWIRLRKRITLQYWSGYIKDTLSEISTRITGFPHFVHRPNFYLKRLFRDQTLSSSTPSSGNFYPYGQIK
jgi:uncharacterized membrane protein